MVLVSSPLLTPSRGSCHEKEETHVAFARALGFGLTTHYPLVMTDGFLKHPAFTSLIFPTNHYFASVLFEDFLAMLDNTFWISHSAYPIYFAFFLDFCVHHKKKNKERKQPSAPRIKRFPQRVGVHFPEPLGGCWSILWIRWHADPEGAFLRSEFMAVLP